MKKGLNYVDPKKMIAIAEALGLKVEDQTNYTKITDGKKGKAVYVAKGKACGRVDLSGFESSGAVAHSKPPSKNVKQELDFTLPEEAILRNFRQVLEDGFGVAEAEEIVETPEQPAEEPKAEEVAA